ncbi:hypothetical protein DPMN_171027 [Dreissena polymorpha]|uniref:Uncharacterized protein n=1 Tax=Dreissena polymorpha TaxID=45954 RepID=A0A9D4DXA7_DREPO|nr:hypothetical protein DPMN_171027 [Dreissena polymorpha]
MLQDENIPEPEKEISWERYGYVNIDVKGRTKRKLMLIKKKTAAKEMFTYSGHNWNYLHNTRSVLTGKSIS